MNTISAAQQINALLTDAGHPTISHQAISDRLRKMADDGLLPPTVRQKRNDRFSWDLRAAHCRFVAAVIMGAAPASWPEWLAEQRKKKKPDE